MECDNTWIDDEPSRAEYHVYVSSLHFASAGISKHLTAPGWPEVKVKIK